MPRRRPDKTSEPSATRCQRNRLQQGGPTRPNASKAPPYQSRCWKPYNTLEDGDKHSSQASRHAKAPTSAPAGHLSIKRRSGRCLPLVVRLRVVLLNEKPSRQNVAFFGAVCNTMSDKSAPTRAARRIPITQRRHPTNQGAGSPIQHSKMMTNIRRRRLDTPRLRRRLRPAI